MKARCYVKSSTDFHNYGARGISVCAEWVHDFASFRTWANTSGYKDYLTLDREDVNGNYEPSNCRWATLSVQARNKQDSCIIATPDGDKLNIHDASEKYGVGYEKLRWRWRKHGDNPDILFVKGNRSSGHLKNTRYFISTGSRQYGITEFAKLHGVSRDRVKYLYIKYGDDVNSIIESIGNS